MSYKNYILIQKHLFRSEYILQIQKSIWQTNFLRMRKLE